MAFERELLHLLAADVPLLGDHLRRAELRQRLGTVTLHPALGAGEGFVETEGLRGQHGGGDRDHAHVLDAASDDDVRRAAHDGLGGEVHGLLRGAALAVDGGAGNFLGQTGREPAGAGDVAGLGADGVDAAENNVLNGGGVYTRAGHQRRERMGAQVGRVNLGQTAVAPAHGGADGLYNISLLHHSPYRLETGTRRITLGTKAWKAVGSAPRDFWFIESPSTRYVDRR